MNSVVISEISLTRFNHQSPILGLASITINGCLVVEGIRLYKKRGKYSISLPENNGKGCSIFFHSKMMWKQIQFTLWNHYWGGDA